MFSFFCRSPLYSFLVSYTTYYIVLYIYILPIYYLPPMYSPCTPFVFLTCQCVSYRQHTAPPSYIHATHSYTILYFLYCMLHVKQMSPTNRLLPHILLCTYHVFTITITYILLSLLLTMYATRYPPPSSVYVYVLVCMYYFPLSMCSRWLCLVVSPCVLPMFTASLCFAFTLFSFCTTLY